MKEVITGIAHVSDSPGMQALPHGYIKEDKDGKIVNFDQRLMKYKDKHVIVTIEEDKQRE